MLLSLSSGIMQGRRRTDLWPHVKSCGLCDLKSNDFFLPYLKSRTSGAHERCCEVCLYLKSRTLGAHKRCCEVCPYLKSRTLGAHECCCEVCPYLKSRTLGAHESCVVCPLRTQFSEVLTQGLFGVPLPQCASWIAYTLGLLLLEHSTF